MNLRLLLLASALTFHAQAQLAPKVPCQSLIALTGYDFTVESATPYPAKDNTPAYCRIRALVQPAIQMEINLPHSWNQRFLMTGNGGYAGESVDPPNSGYRENAMRQGVVLARSNTGHDAVAEPLATFATDRQKFLDYAFRSLHVTALTGKRLAEAYYGEKPKKSYYQGCSTGGRQALILAQRFPNDFDGIISGAPVLNFSATVVSFTHMSQALRQNPIPYPKLKLLADTIYGICDPLDGLKDGLIDDPRKCPFQPARDLPRCAAEERPDCFTPPQIATLEKIYNPILINGQRYFPGWPLGAEIAGPNGRPGWDNWIMKPDNSQTIGEVFAESFFRYMAFPNKKDPNLQLASIDLQKTVPDLAWVHQVLDATETDLAPLRDRGSKLIMFYGWADQALNAQMGVDYYEAVRAKMGPSTPDFFRFYLAPGMFHCGGGPAPNTFDFLTPLINWVEKGTAPGPVEAKQFETPGKLIRSRPLCVYPQVARYQGSGDPNNAANFRCTDPTAGNAR